MSVVYKKLEDVCEILDSRRVPITAKDRKAGTYPYYGANGLQDYVADYIFDDELVLLAEDGGNFGSKERPIAYRVSGKCWVNNHAHVLKAKSNMHVDYLCYALMFYDTEGLVNGATRQKLTQAAMRQMVIPYRDMTEQLQIIKKISQIVRSIEKRKEELQLLDQLVKSRFIELFGDPKQNPKGYPVKEFDEISVLITDGEHATPRRTDKGIYLLSARNILNHALQLDDVDYIDEEEYTRIARRVVPQAGDVLISCSGSIGRCCVVPEELRFQMVRSAALIRFDDTIKPVFAEWLITSDELQRQISMSATQSSQANLFQGKIRKLRGYVPPMELQNQFAAFVEQTDKSKYYSSLSFRYCQAAANTYRQEWMTCRTSDF